jgi:hypothetical protein
VVGLCNANDLIFASFYSAARGIAAFWMTRQIRFGVAGMST